MTQIFEKEGKKNLFNADLGLRLVTTFGEVIVAPVKTKRSILALYLP